MIGNHFISFHSKRQLQKKVRRFSSSCNDASSIGVICSHKSLIGQDNAIEEFVEELKNRGKKVTLLVFHENSSNIDGIASNSFSKRDLNFFGIWKKERVRVFIEKEFDFLINLDLDYNVFVSNIVARSKARCRIGIYNDETKPFLELMIKPDIRSIEMFISELHVMLERIKNDK